MFVVGILLALLALISPVAEEPGTVLESEYIATHTTADLNVIINNFYPPEQALRAQFAVDEYHVRLHSLYKDDEPIVIFAQFFVPRAAEPTELPVYVMGAGSSGLVDACAPSREQPAVQNWGSYRAYLLSMAAQGYITIMPDYAGFNDPDRIQPYYVAEMAGRVLLDAGRAVYDLYASGADWLVDDNAVVPADLVFVAGYSQGGQSVFAAQDLHATYAPDLPLAGIIGFAPVTNMQSHMQTLPQLAPYRMYSWADYYGAEVIPLEEIFTDFWLPTLEEDVLRLCVLDAAGYFSASAAEMYRPAFLEALRGDTMDELYPELHELLELNNPGFVPGDVPALIVQGTEDFSLPMDVHNRFKERYCEAGKHLTELLGPHITHFNTRQVSNRETLEWMQTIIDGEAPRDDCAGE
jgi:hypothetical protein